MTKNIFLLQLSGFVILLMASSSFAQQLPSKEIRQQAQKTYNSFRKPEISFEQFLQSNGHVYAKRSAPFSVNGINGVVTDDGINTSPQDTYCSKVRPYCTNGDFESGLDQSQYTGAYGFWYNSLYPDPFALTYGFISGSLTSSASHHTIVNKSSGNDPTTGIPLVPANGGNQSLRLGNTATGYGTELLAKTLVVNSSETILNFYYAVVFQDPNHAFVEQPAFSVRVYDCATGVELPNVCNLGNNSNIVVSDAQNPFFKSLASGSIAYRDWSLAQVNLSQHVGKTVTIVFTNKDCDQGGHWGYTYIDNLFSTQCPADPIGPVPGKANPGTIEFDIAKSATCEVGNICAKYTVPNIEVSGVTTTGSIVIDLTIYQNGAKVKTVSSPMLTSGTSYCFNINPATSGLQPGIAGFDYSLEGKFTLTGYPLAPIIKGNPPNGFTPGQNNDYLIVCGDEPPHPPQPPVTGNCPPNMTIAADPLTCMAKVSWNMPSTMFPDSISVPKGINLSAGNLVYKGTFGGHGYYQSDDQYTWVNARDAATGVGAHLVAINSAAENSFIETSMMQQFNYTWIGLYNTSMVGAFAWVTGEPFSFTNWIPGEPNNLYNEPNNQTVFESYVHINGFDSLNRWNDNGPGASARFIAEYDSAVFIYKQVSGPANGDSLKPGIYTVCYEKTNTLTGLKESCCFTITVTCSSSASGCPVDVTMQADPATCMATLTWTVPGSVFPDSIAVGNGAHLTYKGELSGHGYYQSTDKYLWTDARDAATAVGAHLITINSPAENNFVETNMNQMSNYAWLGLYNTGTAGNFAWVTGEPLSFTNWIPGEPNNLYNEPGNPTIFEPYASINGYDSLLRWNDLKASVKATLLAEFDSAVITYRQVSGPSLGSMASAGTSTICYEKTNRVTNVTDTCCFNITVTCINPTITANMNSASSILTNEAEMHALDVTAYPNPSHTSFRLKVVSDNTKERIIIKVADLTGRIIDIKSNLTPGNTVTFGNSYMPGVYFTTITQGSKVIVKKLVKQ